MKLIVGLGNPGSKYLGTRHNVGFEVLDRLGRRYADPPGAPAKARFDSLVLDADIDGGRVMLLKPMTYMNRSGTAVGGAVRFYKLDPSEDLLVLVDDVALSCGLIRLRPDGGSGGHNGLADIERELGTDAWTRCRIGIDSSKDIPQHSYVLGQFQDTQREALEPALEEAVSAAALWLQKGTTEAMNTYNRRNTA